MMKLKRASAEKLQELRRKAGQMQADNKYDRPMQGERERKRRLRQLARERVKTHGA